MAEEDFSRATQPASDQRRIIMVRGVHRGQFTKLKKVNALLLRNIDSQTGPFEGEALLQALHDKVHMIQKPDAKIELAIEYQDDLTTERDQFREIHTAASIPGPDYQH